MIRTALKVFCAASLAAALAATWRAVSYRRSVDAAAESEVMELTVRGAAGIDAELREAMGAAQALADDLSSGRLSYDGVDGRLRKTLEAHPFLHSANAAFEPDAYKRGVRLHIPSWAREPDGPRARRDDSDDYTRSEALWYARAKERAKPVWVAPFYRPTSNSLTAVYAVPFFPRGGGAKPAGVVSVTLSLDELKRLVESLDLGPSGFGELVAADGTYLYHPRNDYVLARKTMVDLGRELHDADRLEVWPAAAAGRGGVVDHISTNTGQRSWFIYEPVPSAGWSLQNTFLRDDVPLDAARLRRRLARAMLAVLAFLLSAGALLLGGGRFDARALWRLSILASALMTAGVGFMWRLALSLDPHVLTGGAAISDKAALSRVVEHYSRLCAERHAEPPVFIPTGVFIETARFTGPSDVSVGGYVWQKYDLKAAKGLSQGFVLRDAGDVKIAEAYREREGGVEIVRWSFSAVLHENMNFAKYPLDQEDVALSLRHKDLDHNVVLIPDLGSYKILAATAKPGLAPEFKVPGWRTLKTFFDLSGTLDGTTFGLTRSVAKEDFPGLRFNVVLRRNLLDAFISNLGPILISLILLFALQMVSTSDEKLAAFMQTTSGRLVNICVGMFFVIIFAHVNVRRGLAAEEIFYLEYFYFATYVMILWVAINSIVFVKMKHLRWLQHEENLIPKLLFWPAVAGILLAASVATFY